MPTPDPCDWPSLISAPGACAASGPFIASFLSGFAAGSLTSALAWVFKLPQRAWRRWDSFWRWSPPLPPLKRVVIVKTYAPTALKLFGFKHERTRGQRLRRWWRGLWPSWRDLRVLWLRRCWRPLLAVVRRLLLPRG